MSITFSSYDAREFVSNSYPIHKYPQDYTNLAIIRIFFSTSPQRKFIPAPNRTKSLGKQLISLPREISSMKRTTHFSNRDGGLLISPMVSSCMKKKMKSIVCKSQEKASDEINKNITDITTHWPDWITHASRTTLVKALFKSSRGPL